VIDNILDDVIIFVIDTFYRKKCPKTPRPKAPHKAAPATHLRATGSPQVNNNNQGD